MAAGTVIQDHMKEVAREGKETSSAAERLRQNRIGVKLVENDCWVLKEGTQRQDKQCRGCCGLPKKPKRQLTFDF